MTKFLTNLIFFFTVLIIFLSPLLFLKIGGKNLKFIDNPVAALIDKHNRIQKLPSPKLIIVGGSNAFYGMNSYMLKNRLNINVVNMALFAGFGLNFMLKELEGNVKSNDILVLSLEYFLPTDVNPKAKEEILRYFPKAYNYFNSTSSISEKYFNSIKVNIESIQNIVLRPLKRRSSIYVYSRKINAYGDAIGYLDYKAPAAPDLNIKLNYRYWEGIKKINDFVHNNPNMRIYFVFPPIPLSMYNINKESIYKYFNDFKVNLSIPMLCKPSDMIFNDSLFFDTEYHLNKEGRDLRTEKLIEMLKKVMN